MAVSYGARIKGLKQARDKLGHFTRSLDAEVAEVILEEAVRMEAEAKMMVPVDSGDLKRSITTDVTQRGTSVTLNMSASSVHNGYDYAARQHNDTTLNHPNGGEPFFISKPFTAGVDRISRRLDREVKYD